MLQELIVLIFFHQCRWVAGPVRLHSNFLVVFQKLCSEVENLSRTRISLVYSLLAICCSDHDVNDDSIVLLAATSN